jgi:hypothetical protein
MGPTGLLKPATTRPLSQWSKGALGKETSNAFIVVSVADTLPRKRLF